MISPSLLAAAGAEDLSPDEARSALRRELLQPGYSERDLMSRLMQWIDRQFNQLTAAASEVGALSYLAASALALTFVLALVLLVSRVRGDARTRARSPVALLDDRVTADQWRSSAQAALAQGRDEDALVDAFRALAVRQVELRRIEDAPGATAHEVAVRLIDLFEDHAEEIAAAAALFDQTLYGEHRVGAAQAEALLNLESRLAQTR